MIKAVIFDLYETLITHYNSPLYFGAHIARDAGIPEEKFLPAWRNTEYERSIGTVTLEEVLEGIFKENHCYLEALVHMVAQKRTAMAEDLYSHLNGEILPMLETLRDKGMKIGLISNCYPEEAKAFRKSELFPYFDVVCLSCELGMAKPDKEIFLRCVRELAVNPEECLYVGDGGSKELETADALGMKAVQAVWYLQEGTLQPAKRKSEYLQMEKPLEIIRELFGVI